MSFTGTFVGNLRLYLCICTCKSWTISGQSHTAVPCIIPYVCPFGLHIYFLIYPFNRQDQTNKQSGSSSSFQFVTRFRINLQPHMTRRHSSAELLIWTPNSVFCARTNKSFNVRRAYDPADCPSCSGRAAEMEAEQRVTREVNISVFWTPDSLRQPSRCLLM